MGNTGAVLFILCIAALAANLPFFTERVLGFQKPPIGKEKPLGWRVVELVVLYFIVGFVAHGLEVQAHGTAYPQGWAFYAITACLFLVLAYPGFVFRYLWKPAHKSLPPSSQAHPLTGQNAASE
jgi:hypothetical protein